MKVFYYVLLSIVSSLFFFTLYGFLEGPSYGKDDSILWGSWALLSLVLSIVLMVFRKNIFSMKSSKGVLLMLTLVCTMCTLVDAVYVMQKISSTVITSCKINQSLIFGTLLCITGLLFYLYKRKPANLR